MTAAPMPITGWAGCLQMRGKGLNFALLVSNLGGRNVQPAPEPRPHIGTPGCTLLENTIERIGQKKCLFGMTASQI